LKDAAANQNGSGSEREHARERVFNN